MPSVDVVVSTPVVRTPRVVQLEGLFDVAPAEREELKWSVDLPIDAKPWNIGLVVGPSGCGKSTIARKLWAEQMAASVMKWPKEKSVIDGFPADMSIKDIVQLLSSVGFSSPPAWLRPFGVLSNGEQFRVTMARLLAELPELAVVDEFTSVVDRKVAQIGSAAIAKTVRRREQRLVAVTCHEDVEEWLQPDWVYRPAERAFQWRCLQRRPGIEIEARRVHYSAWRLFAHHHYLDTNLAVGAHCYVGFYKGEPVVFEAVMPMVAPGLNGRNAWRASRVVVLPDYQGIGLGITFGDLIASAYRGVGMRYYASLSHPAVMQALAKSHRWALVRNAKFGRQIGKGHYRGLGRKGKHAMTRITAGFEYVGPEMPRDRALEMIGWSHDKRVLCSVGGCDREPVARRLCALHYQQKRRSAA